MTSKLFGVRSPRGRRRRSVRVGDASLRGMDGDLVSIEEPRERIADPYCLDTGRASQCGATQAGDERSEAQGDPREGRVPPGQGVEQVSRSLLDCGNDELFMPDE